jgi:transposase-like protein
MPMKNKYINRSRISEAKFRQFIKYFTLDLEAQKIAILIRLNRNTVNRYLRLIRERIAEHCENQSSLKGEIEVDESYFGARRIKGKSGRGASGKTPVFGILQRGGKVYTEIVPDCAKATLQAVIRGIVSP